VRVMLVSKFLHHVGGVETYLRWQAHALEAAGHRVAVLGMRPPAGSQRMDLGGSVLYETTTRSFVDASYPARMRSAAASVYSFAAGDTMRRAIEEFKPDVIHFHGTCYQLTSSVVRASRRAGVRRVATAHEYKLVCSNQRLWADAEGTKCTRCVGSGRLGRLVNPVQQSCIKSSRAASLVGGLEAVVSDSVWREDGDLTIHTPSRFMADMLLADGWDRRRIRTLDLPWPEMSTRAEGRGDHFLYMGRLAPEKDVATLVMGWQRAASAHPARRLLIAGSGAEEGALRAWVARQDVPRVEFLGQLDVCGIETALRSAAATVHPAAWYENSPFAVRESLMAGVPALVAKVGGMPELVEAGRTGLLVEHGVDGWAEALASFDSAGLRRGVDLLHDASTRRTSSADHLNGLLAIYAE
jgi:glycosyltransferase involved in cell wall biosynthesis